MTEWKKNEIEKAEIKLADYWGQKWRRIIKIEKEDAVLARERKNASGDKENLNPL